MRLGLNLSELRSQVSVLRKIDVIRCNDAGISISMAFIYEDVDELNSIFFS